MKQFVKSLPVTPAEYDTGLDDLVRAAIKGDLERMKSLLEAGHPVDPKDEHRETPLMIASRGDPEIARMRFQLRKVDETLYQKEANKRYVQCVRLLLAHGADVNNETDAGNTALRTSIFCGQTEIESLLWDAGATNLGKGPDLGSGPRPR